MVASPTHPRAHLGSEQGFTLVEFMIAGLVMTIVLGSTVALAMQMQQAYTTQLEDAGLEQEARFALDWIARDLRSAGSDAYYQVDATQELFIDPNAGGDPDDSIRIQADINPPDGLLDDPGEDITIDLRSGVITRTDTNAALTEGMTDAIFTDLQFTFLDWTRAVTTIPAAVAYVQVQVTAQSRAWDTNMGAFPTSTLSTEVRLRAR